MIKNLLKKVFILRIKLKEKSHSSKCKYLFFRNRSKKLLIVFSGFTPGNKRRYNYVRSFNKLKCDKLYILDTYGYKGSYYMYEAGTSLPEIEVTSLIQEIINKYKYTEIVTAGTSKGGSCSIYYGLLFGATKIFAGACQYNLGTYLKQPQHLDILKGMMGESNVNDSVMLLDNKIRSLISNKLNNQTIIYLLYSKQEPTYEEDIVDLLSDLRFYDYTVNEHIETFNNHSDVGLYFPNYVKFNIG